MTSNASYLVFNLFIITTLLENFPKDYLLRVNSMYDKNLTNLGKGHSDIVTRRNKKVLKMSSCTFVFLHMTMLSCFKILSDPIG